MTSEFPEDVATLAGTIVSRRKGKTYPVGTDGKGVAPHLFRIKSFLTFDINPALYYNHCNWRMGEM